MRIVEVPEVIDSLWIENEIRDKPLSLFSPPVNPLIIEYELTGFTTMSISFGGSTYEVKYLISNPPVDEYIEAVDTETKELVQLHFSSQLSDHRYLDVHS
jgi:hypothetical protein